MSLGLLKIAMNFMFAFVATAPIFIVKLPREKTIKVGATLLFNCLVEKTNLQECLVGVDIIAKGELTATLLNNNNNNNNNNKIILNIIIFLTLGTYDPEGDEKLRKLIYKLGYDHQSVRSVYYYYYYSTHVCVSVCLSAPTVAILIQF